jgi:hypothetical protein
MEPTEEQLQNQRAIAAAIMASIPPELGPEIDRARDMIIITPLQPVGVTPELERAFIAKIVEARANELSGEGPCGRDVWEMMERLFAPAIEAMMKTDHDREAWASIRGRVIQYLETDPKEE